MTAEAFIGAKSSRKLVAADGGVWESQALENVRSYLVEALKDIPDREKLTIIA